MTISIPNKLNELDIIKQLVELMNGYEADGFKKKANSLDNYLYSKLTDYVTQFVNITDDTREKAEVDYIVAILYEAKGTLEVFDLMEKHLNLKFKEKPDYKIDYLNLDIAEAEGVDLSKYMKALIDMMATLLYFAEISVIIRIFKLIITSELYSRSYVYGYKYKEYNFSYFNKEV